jgi:hypothetical protein
MCIMVSWKPTFDVRTSMTDKERDTGSAEASGSRQDEEAALERELQREAAEGGDAIGDMRENRNVSGSSTWETLSEGQRSSAEGDQPEVF